MSLDSGLLEISVEVCPSDLSKLNEKVQRLGTVLAEADQLIKELADMKIAVEVTQILR